MLAVPEHHISDISDSEAVDKNIADLDLLPDCRSVLTELEDISGAQNKDIVFLISQITQKLCLRLEVAEFAVHGNRVSGLYQMVNQFDVFLAGVTGRVDILGNDVRSLQHKLVDDARDRLLIARNRT